MRRNSGLAAVVLGLGFLSVPGAGSAGDKSGHDWPTLVKEDFEKGADTAGLRR